MPLAELLDALDLTTTEPVRDRIVVDIRCSPSTFATSTPGELVPTSVHLRPDRAAGRAGRRRRTQRHPAFIGGPLPEQPGDDVILADLVGFFKDPVKGFFRAMEYTLPRDVDGVHDAMPVEIDTLEDWTVGDRMLRDMLRGMTADRALDAEWRRGTLPPGQLGWRKATEIRDQADLLATGRGIPACDGRGVMTSTSTSAAGAGSPARCHRCTASGLCR